MTKNLLLPLALILVLSLSLVACGDNSAPSDSGNNSTTEPLTSDNDDVTTTVEAVTSGTVEEISRPPASAELSAEWNSYQFELEGKIYTLPLRYSELEANGWTAQNAKNMEETLESGKYILNYITLSYGGKENTEIGVQFVNLDDEDRTLAECYVGGIQLAENSWNKNTVLYFPGGFTIGSTKEEVEALYGEPNATQDRSTTIEWTYETQNYATLTFTFTKETGKIEKMRMSNLYLS